MRAMLSDLIMAAPFIVLAGGTALREMFEADSVELKVFWLFVCVVMAVLACMLLPPIKGLLGLRKRIPKVK